jgi:MtrB/PioB family decaheme-associated outer membrane protein
VPGDNSLAGIESALASVADSSIRVLRSSGGVQGEVEVWRELDLFAGYSHTKREGTRAGGGVLFPDFGQFGQPAGSLVETVEPVDWRTHDFSGGLRYGGQRIQANLVYTGQIFVNRDDSLLWENPFRQFDPGTPSTIPEGRSALAPDNQWHNIRGDVGVGLPGQGRLTATVSWSRMSQDDDLLAPTVNSAFSNWDDAATALSRDSAEAKVDTLLADLRLRFKPWRPLSLEGRFRYFDRDNRTDYAALNPSTGSYGYVIEDGSLGIQPRYAAIPFGYRRWNVDAIATWRPGRRTSTTLAYEYETYERENREVKTTRENRVRASLSSSAFSWATLRVSYEYGDRQGSSYDRARNQCFYDIDPNCATDPATTGPERSLVELRKYDQVDRTQHLVNARLNFPIGESLDLALAGGYRDDDFGADYGRLFQRSGNANLELDFRPSPGLGLHVFGSFESGDYGTASIADDVPFGTDYNAGGPIFPFANEWSTDSERRTWGAGFGLSLAFWTRFDWRVDYSFFDSAEKLAYDFDPAGNALAGVTAAEAGSRFSDLRYLDHSFQTSLRTYIDGGAALRFTYSFRDSRIDNYQQTGLEPIVAGQHVLYLGHVDRDFTTHVFTASLQYQF